MNKVALTIALSALVLSCSSADTSGGDDAAAFSDGADGAILIDGGRDSAPLADAGSADVFNVDASPACVKYCDCMKTNCADKVFANGCLFQCAAQTKWDLPCRTNMCSLVPAQPNNDHCTHAFGMNQCLDH